jgi:hypothetical protein
MSFFSRRNLGHRGKLQTSLIIFIYCGLGNVPIYGQDILEGIGVGGILWIVVC